jgi:hypothetical protein
MAKGFYTRKMLEAVLRRIDYEAFDIYNDKVKMSLPSILDQMFIIGFNNELNGISKVMGSDGDILRRAYYQIHVSPGYFQFEEDI